MIERAAHCNHLTCNFCQRSLCLMCRKCTQSSHLNAFHAFVCTQAHAHLTQEHLTTREDTSRAELSMWYSLAICSLIILLMPLVAVTVVPYAAARNVLEYLGRLETLGKSRKDKGLLKMLEDRVKRKVKSSH